MRYAIHPYGDKGLLITVPENIQPATVRTALDAALGTTSRIGLDTVLIHGDLPTSEAITAVLSTVTEATTATASREITIPVRYDGEDLAGIATHLGIAPEAVIAAHQETPWEVALVGFAPGFPYLKPIHGQSLFSSVPRLASPRTQVPAGAVAVAAGLSAIYPSAMPGGWMLLGSTDLVLFDPTSENPSLLAPGDRVTFEEAHA